MFKADGLCFALFDYFILHVISFDHLKYSEQQFKKIT